MKSLKYFMALGLVLGCVLMIAGQATAQLNQIPEWRVDFIESASPDGPVDVRVTGPNVYINYQGNWTEGAEVYVSSFWTNPPQPWYSYYALTEPGTNGLISDLLEVNWRDGLRLTFTSDQQEGQYLVPRTDQPGSITYVAQENGELQLLYSVVEGSELAGSLMLISVYGQSDVDTVPEPATILLLGLGLMGLTGVRRKFKK